ncbi:MAG: T9SS type A sorting domain-containing protein [Bacteroidales bacterium]|nr:T9SS type A sorting domain-containing protein [Bacteroidales bacterium]
MSRYLFYLLLLCVPVLIYGQQEPDYPDLGLNGTVTWIDSTHISVEYDWSDDSQLQDWITTNGSSLVMDIGTVTIDGGYTSIRAMIWKQGIKCSRIIAKDAVALTSEGHHLNFYTDLTSFAGDNYLPDPGLGAVLADYKNFWVQNGTNAGDIGAPYIVTGVARDYEFTVSAAGMTIKSSVDNIVYSYNNNCAPELDRKIALGGWGGNTRWGKITIEGEITWPWQYDPVPEDVINIQSDGAVFAPVIEVSGTPVIEWIFHDSTTSSSATPAKEYGTAGPRRNYLRVTPWSALVGINVGYDASDGGYGEFDVVSNQNVVGFRNLNLATNSLRYICASYNPLAELDLRELTALEFVELYKCQFLSRLKLGIHPDLERLCVENCDLDSLDLSGCEGLEDLRGALNSYASIKWGSIGQSLWHLCIRDNPQMDQNLPDLTQFPVLRELLNWNTNQTGAFICHSSAIRVVESYNNYYTSVDVSDSPNLRNIDFSECQLTALNFGNGGYMKDVRLRNCNLTESLIDYVLQVLDAAGHSYGILDLTGNSAPSSTGLVHIDNLIARGWTIDVVTGSEDLPDDKEPLKIIVTGDEIRIHLEENLISWQASLYNLNGVQIYSQLVDSDLMVFDISSLTPGIYVVELSEGKQSHTKKIIIP